MRLSLIAAVAENGVIGRDGGLPWHLPDDLRRFRALTTGHHVIMGRRTHESIGRPLPGRTNLVLSRNPAYRPGGCAVAATIEAAIEAARGAGDGEAFVIGGAAVYAAVLPRADRIYLTRIAAAVEGDVRFPALAPAEWMEVSREEHGADERHALPFRFLVLERRRAG